MKTFSIIFVVLFLSLTACQKSFPAGAESSDDELADLSKDMQFGAVQIIPDAMKQEAGSATALLPTETATAALSFTPTAVFCADGNCGQACLVSLPDIVQPDGGLTDLQHSYQGIFGEDGLPLVTYAVRGDLILDPTCPGDIPEWLQFYQDDTQFHQELWSFFTTLIPSEQRSDVLRFQLMTDGKDEILASVYPSEEDPYVWVFEIDVMDISNIQDFSNTLIHEVGHLISLNPVQVPPSMPIFENPYSDAVYFNEVDACTTYFPGEGCANPDSYINLFYQAFWTELFDEWSYIDGLEYEDEYYDALDSFYVRYHDQFVTDYAVTNPEEDFAETFTAFILGSQPEGDTIAEEKILFFYEFPELVELRAHIARGLCTMSME